MEDQLDALILQGQKNNEETNGLLEALIVQNKNNNTQPEIEALIVQNKNLTKTVKSGRDKIVEAVKELKTEPVKELSISNPDDISKAVVERLAEFESTIKEYFAQKLAVEKEKDSKRSKHTADKEKSLGELKNGIIKAIESLSKSLPKSLDYSKTLKSILQELENKEVNLSIVENGLKTIADEVKKILPDKLIDDDRVKVVLSDEQIKKLLDGLNIQVTNSSSEYAVNVNGTRINRATIEKQSEISAKLDPATDIETQDLITVGPTAVEITFTNDAGQVILCAGDANSGNIFIGKSDVANNGNKAFAVLSPGQTRAFPYDKSVNALYAISSTSNQKLSASLKLGNGSITFDGFDSRISPNLAAINGNISGILGKFVYPNYVNKQDIILNGGTDFPFENNSFGPHKVRKSSNERTNTINAGGDWYGCSGRDLSTSGGGIVTVDISRQNLDHQYRALESVKFKITNDVAAPEVGVVEIRLMGFDARTGACVLKAFTCLEINTTKLTDKDTYVCGMTPTVIAWNKDDFRFGYIEFRDVGGTLSSRDTLIEVLLEDYSFN